MKSQPIKKKISQTNKAKSKTSVQRMYPKVNIIGLRELRENTTKYIRQIEKGESFTVVRKSKPIFRVIPVDEWGDEGTWKTLIDFTKIDKKGIPAEKILEVLRSLAV